MDIWTIIIIGGIGFLLLSYLAPKISNFKMPNIPFINPSNQTQSDNNQTSQPSLPSPLQKGIDTLEQKYNLPLWVLVLLVIFLYIIFKR